MTNTVFEPGSGKSNFIQMSDFANAGGQLSTSNAVFKPSTADDDYDGHELASISFIG